jgi:hypothetical protein
MFISCCVVFAYNVFAYNAFVYNAFVYNAFVYNVFAYNVFAYNVFAYNVFECNDHDRWRGLASRWPMSDRNAAREERTREGMAKMKDVVSLAR